MNSNSNTNSKSTKKIKLNTDVNYYIRASGERGYFDHGWLKSFHSFSFGDYYDPNWMGFHHLRVINDDWIATNSGFPLHGHRHMEIVSVILQGQIEHKDTLGHSEIIPKGSIQVMNAGTGIRHSEYNPSKTEDLRLLQVWIEPNSLDIQPGYIKYDFHQKLQTPGLCHLENLNIHQDANIILFQADNKTKDQLILKPGQSLWVQTTQDNLQIELNILENQNDNSVAKTNLKKDNLIFNLNSNTNVEKPVIKLNNGDALAILPSENFVQIDIQSLANNTEAVTQAMLVIQQ